VLLSAEISDNMIKLMLMLETIFLRSVSSSSAGGADNDDHHDDVLLLSRNVMGIEEEQK
jgi:hypothetical protein